MDNKKISAKALSKCDYRKKVGKFFACLLMVVIIVSSVSVCFASAASNNWAGSWGSPAVKAGVNLGQKDAISKGGVQIRDTIPARSTTRTEIVSTLGGSKIRIKLSNQYGEKAVTVDETTIAKKGKDDKSIDKNSLRQITFNGGEKSVTIAPGSEVLSDEINFNVKNLDTLSISMYFSKTTRLDCQGMFGGQTYMSTLTGNKTHDEKMPNMAALMNFTAKTITYHTIPFLTRLDVYSPGAYTFVIFGDSTVTNDSYIKLEEKLVKNGITNVGIIMSGIIGNRVLYDGAGLLGSIYGDAAISRFSRDCLNIPGVRYCLVKIGLNDIIHPNSTSMKGKAPKVTIGQIENGYVELARQARQKGIVMTLCDRPPFKGYERNFLGDTDFVWTEDMHKMIESLNYWIQHSATRNGYSYAMNINKMVDKSDPTRIIPHLTTDGAHLSQNGQIAFVDLIPEYVYGVGRSLTPLASIRKVDPYKVPVEATTAKKETTTKSSGGETTTKKEGPTAAVITPATTAPVQVVVPPVTEKPTEKANEVVVGGTTAPVTTAPSGDNINAAVSEDSAPKKNIDKKPIIIFSVAAVVAIGVIVTCIVLLNKTGGGLTAFSRGSDSPKYKKKRSRNNGV